MDLFLFGKEKILSRLTTNNKRINKKFLILFTYPYQSNLFFSTNIGMEKKNDKFFIITKSLIFFDSRLKMTSIKVTW